MNGIDSWIAKRAELHPEREALVGEHLRLSYRELNERINKLQVVLKEQFGLQVGERIAILTMNCPEYFEVLFAAAGNRLILVPLNLRLTIPELEFQLKDSGAKLLFISPEFVDKARELKSHGLIQDVVCIPTGLATHNEFLHYEDLLEQAKITPELSCSGARMEDPLLICYTSGTTGNPKGAVLSQGNMFWNAVNNTLAIGLTYHDVMLTLLPLFHVGGIGLFALPTFYAGGKVVVPRKFDPEQAVQAIEQEQVTLVMGVPTIHESLLNSAGFTTADLSSVRLFYTGGAPCPLAIFERYREKGLQFGQGFGLTETSPTVFMMPAEQDFYRKAGSVGKPAMFVDVKLIDEHGNEVKPGDVGEVVVKGANVFTGYWNLPEATQEALRGGWFHTGDLAVKDEKGFYYIKGRKKEMIISGGENIYPVEVENVIRTHPAVLDVAIVGISDEQWGEVAKAYIIKKSGENLSAQQINKFCISKLAKYKVPKVVEFIEELPRNAAGKVLKRDLR